MVDDSFLRQNFGWRGTRVLMRNLNQEKLEKKQKAKHLNLRGKSRGFRRFSKLKKDELKILLSPRDESGDNLLCQKSPSINIIYNDFYINFVKTGFIKTDLEISSSIKKILNILKKELKKRQVEFKETKIRL